jgi:transglycosylase-like protein with SLT domain
VAVETVVFGDRGLAPVRLLRGPVAVSSGSPQLRPPPRPIAVRPVALPRAAATPPVSTELVSFGDGTATRVKVVRGGALPGALATRIDPLARTRIETVSFHDPRLPTVTVMRGPSARDPFAVDLFGPANGGELDRVAFAVDGVESRHGADLRMWRPEPNGPQGPMQVSLAAALDVGGGDRFDMRENRLLGRAYLAQMFQRYGNWQDALAAYNWGPGNVDLWIAGGRNTDFLPSGVVYYVARVLRDTLVGGATAHR